MTWEEARRIQLRHREIEERLKAERESLPRCGAWTGLVNCQKPLGHLERDCGGVVGRNWVERDLVSSVGNYLDESLGLGFYGDPRGAKK